MRAKLLLLIIIFLIGEGFLFSQSNSSNNAIDIAYSYGGILRHSDELPSLGVSRINGLTVRYSRISTLRDKWEKCYCFPEIGYGLAYYNFGDPQMLGYSLNPFLSVAPYLNPNGKIHFIPRGAAGISYVSRIYNEKSNPENIFFSSHISGFLQLHLSVRYEPVDQFQVQAGFSYNHISNGGLKQPNKGMNFITANFGANYFFSPPEFLEYELKQNYEELIDRWRYRFTGSYTLKVAQKENNFDRKNTSVVGIMATAGYFIPRFSIIEGGVEFISDGYLKEQLSRQNSEKDHNRIALLAGHTFKFGRLGFATLLGVYLHSPVKAMDPVYQRYQLTYDFGQRLSLGVGLKAHRHVAELMMVNLGVRL